MHSESFELQATKPKIMVVEDNPLVLDVLRTLLTDENYEVFVQVNGEDALSSLAMIEADLILCDVMMPIMDGFTLQKRLREQNQYANIPFVFLTALGDSENVLKGKSSGADAYLVKPFDPNELLATIRGKIERSKDIQEFYQKKQDEFSSQVIRHISHEFRTPLVAVTTGSELLLSQQENLAKDKISSLVSTIWRGGQRLEKIINNFILLQQIQAGQAQKNYQTYSADLNLLDFVKSYLQKNKKYLVDHQCEVSFEFDQEETYQLIAYPQHLGLILDRLIDNAIKFTKEPRKIKVTLENDTRTINLSITDNGNGFDKNCFKNLSQVFYQHQREINEQQGGGLGLVISKFLTRINKGRIKFNNSPEGGAVVTLFLSKPVVED